MVDDRVSGLRARLATFAASGLTAAALLAAGMACSEPASPLWKLTEVIELRHRTCRRMSPTPRSQIRILYKTKPRVFLLKEPMSRGKKSILRGKANYPGNERADQVDSGACATNVTHEGPTGTTKSNGLASETTQSFVVRTNYEGEFTARNPDFSGNGRAYIPRAMLSAVSLTYVSSAECDVQFWEL